MAATATTTADALWDVLYAWATGVLPGVAVVPSHENAPSPDGNYIVINYAGTWRRAGTTPSKRIDNRPDLPAPNVYVYRGSVQVRDVDGNGDNLMRLVESLDDYGVLTAFADAGISVLKTNGPVAMPALQQTKWRRESVLTLEMTWARANEGTTLTIESVEINGETYSKPGQGE